jgi:hypothetical protein
VEGSDSMTDEKRKMEPPLFLDMDFGEALERFARIRPDEVNESVERSKEKKKPPGEKPARRSSRKRDT